LERSLFFGGVPTAFCIGCGKKTQNVLLLSKRKHVIIPVGNLKVDEPSSKLRPSSRAF
jgi:hypothetical protein